VNIYFLYSFQFHTSFVAQLKFPTVQHREERGTVRILHAMTTPAEPTSTSGFLNRPLTKKRPRELSPRPLTPRPRAPAYEGATTRLVRRTAHGEETVQLNHVNVGDEVKSLDANADEEWVVVRQTRSARNANMCEYTARYLQDPTYAFGGFAMAMDGDVRVLCSLPPPFVTQDREGGRVQRETYVPPGREEEDGVHLYGATKTQYCSQEGAAVKFRQGWHVAACANDANDWVRMTQAAVTARLGPGFDVSLDRRFGGFIRIQHKASGQVQEFRNRRTDASTWEFSGLHFYVDREGDVDPLPIRTSAEAEEALYEKLEQLYVPFVERSPIELVEADAARMRAMALDAEHVENGCVQFLGAGANFLVGIPVGNRTEPVIEDVEDIETNALKCYMLGLWLGDGCVSGTPNTNVATFAMDLHEDEGDERRDIAADIRHVANLIRQANADELVPNDDGVKDDVKDILVKLTPLMRRGYIVGFAATVRANCACLRVESPQFCEWLRTLNLITRKGDCDFEELTMDLLRRPSQIRLAFMAGLLDADGGASQYAAEAVMLTQAVEGGIDAPRILNAAHGHGEIFSLFGIIASSLPMDMRYKVTRSRVGGAFANVAGQQAYDARFRNCGAAYVLSPEHILPSALRRKTNVLFPRRFIRIGSTFGIWRNVERRSDCIELTVDGGSGHVLLSNGTLIAVNRYEGEEGA
jgi:hypothetical protein